MVVSGVDNEYCEPPKTRPMTVITDISRPQPVRSASGKTSTTVKPVDNEDTVSISPTTALLAEAEDIATSSEDVDEARVEDIKSAIRDGKLTINHERLAQKMLEFELTLFDD